MSDQKLPVAVVDEDAVPRPKVVARFQTIAEAEDYIAKEGLKRPSKVWRGGFGIDAPEEMINGAPPLAHIEEPSSAPG